MPHLHFATFTMANRFNRCFSERVSKRQGVFPLFICMRQFLALEIENSLRRSGGPEPHFIEAVKSRAGLVFLGGGLENRIAV
jgi:hypothetical protein